MDVTSRRMQWYSGFDKIPNFELHNDEGRSYLTRSHEKFDMIQATVVDTWAATAAGAMALTENSLYSLDGWRIFYEHLNPGGVIAFSRWNHKPDFHETTRLFSLAYATLLSEGVKDPETHLAMIRQDELATLLTSNQPFSAAGFGKDSHHRQGSELPDSLSARRGAGDAAIAARVAGAHAGGFGGAAFRAIILTFLRPPILPPTSSALCASTPFPESCEFPACIGRCCCRFCI